MKTCLGGWEHGKRLRTRWSRDVWKWRWRKEGIYGLRKELKTCLRGEEGKAERKRGKKDVEETVDERRECGKKEEEK